MAWYLPHRIITSSGLALLGVAPLVVGLAAQSPAPPASRALDRADQQPADRPPVIYAVDVSLVEVDALVTDGDGRVIRDMRRDEFRIFEDGKQQAIDRLSFIEIPIERADARS